MIAVVIVTFAADPSMLDSCVESVLAGGNADRLIVVDNGSTARVAAGVDLIRPRRNLGFGGGANAGFRRAAEFGATHIALLNDDIEVESGWLRPLAAALTADPKVGAVQPKLLIAGSTPPRINSMGVMVAGDGSGRDIAYDELDGPRYSDNRLIESFTGGAVLFRAEFLRQTGGFDDSYFLYYEDLDLARRGSALSWTYLCVPASRVWHRVSASTAKLGNRARFLQERNRLRFAFRFADRATVVQAVWLSVRRLRWTPRATHAKALLAGLGRAPATFFWRFRAR